MKHISYVALAGLFVLSACKNLGDIPTSRPSGIVTLGTGDAPGGVHKMSPTAYFVDAVNISFPNSRTILDQCTQLSYPGTTFIAPLSQIPAGAAVTIASPLDTAQLLPAPVDANGYIIYRMSANDSMRVVPGVQNHVTIPGATNGFDAFDFGSVGADSLFVQPIEANPDSTHALPIQWNAQTPGTTSIGLQLEFNTSASGSTPNSQIFCSFDDDGHDTVPELMSNAWRNGGAQRVHAYRWVTTVTSNGNQQVIVISQYSTDSTHVLIP